MLGGPEKRLLLATQHYAHKCVSLRKTADKGTGWLCKGPIKKHETILRIPASSWLPYSADFAAMEAAKNSPTFVQTVKQIVKKFKTVNEKSINAGTMQLDKLEASIYPAA